MNHLPSRPETSLPSPQKTYPFMSKDAESMQQLRQSRALFRSLDPGFKQEQKQQKHKQQHHRRHRSTIPHTHYERISEKTIEIVFGPVQEQEQRRVVAAGTAKPTECGDKMNSHQNLHYRAQKSVSYRYGYYSYT